jgi:hypothetical protein
VPGIRITSPSRTSKFRLGIWILTAVGVCLSASNLHSQSSDPELRFHIDLNEVTEIYKELNLFPEAVWDTIPPFDYDTIKLGEYREIPNFLKSDFKRTNRVVEYDAVPGYRLTYTYPKVYSFNLRETSQGEFYTYEPRDVTIEGLEIKVEKLDDITERIRRQSLEASWREVVVSSVTSPGQPGDQRRRGLISVDIPLPMPSQLESIFGPGEKTHIDITGREEITFAGESRKTEPFIGVEGQQKQSLFPSLDMEQKLDVSLTGTIGDKVFVEVDHSSQPMLDKANNIQLYYVGYEDDVIKRIDLGNTNLTLTGSNLLSFSTSSTGLFGVKMLAEIGSTELTVIASKQEGETSSSSFSPTGGGALGQTEERVIRDIDYIRNQYFYFDNPRYVYIPDIHPKNDDPTVPIEIWREIDPGQKTSQPDLDWEAGKAFLDTDGRGTNLKLAALMIKNGTPASDLPVHVPGDFERLVENVDYEFIFDFDDPNAVVGFVLTRPVDDNKALAVSYLTVTGDTVGGPYSRWDIPRGQGVAQRDTMILELVKPRVPRPDNEFGFTWDYMMRNFYNLGLSNIEPVSFELEIRDRTPRLDTTSPTGSTVPYIRIFGLDQENAAGDPGYDGRIDIRPEILNTATGILQFPDVHAFAPDTVRVREDWTDGQFSFSDSLYQSQWNKSNKLYTQYLTNPFVDAYQYEIVVRAVSTSKSFRIEALNIVENSERITLDGKALVRGVDYSINYDTGDVELKGGVLDDLTPTSKINIDYEFTPFGGSASSSLVGFSTQSKYGENARLGSIFLYESKGTSMEKPRLGEEPTRAVVGGLNGQFQHNSKFLTKLANILPLVDTDAASTITMSGEIAASVPDPNTKGESYIEDFEGIEDSDRISMSRRSWYQASVPVDPSDMQSKVELDSLWGFLWYNIEPNQGGVHRRDLNPDLNTRENTLVPTLDLEIDPRLNPLETRWIGVMTGFGAGGLDLSRGQYLEIWVNDFKPDPADRGGFLRIDMGRIDENFFDPANGDWDDEDQERDGFQRCWDDTGLDGEFNANPSCVANNIGISRDEESGDPNIDANGDDYVPQRIDGRFSKINGTEKNGVYDTEDLDRSGQMDRVNSYYSFVVDLSDTAVVDIRESFPNYFNEADFNTEQHGLDSWRLYRIKLSDATIVSPSGSEPRFDEIRHVRVWFDDIAAAFQDVEDPGRRRFQIAEMKIVGNRWERDGVRDLADQLIPDSLATSTEFNIGVISTKTDPARYNPPIIPREENGVFEKEQSMFIQFDDLGPETSIRVFKQFVGRGLDLTSYRDLNFWVHADRELFNQDLEYYFRMAFDEDNFYEIKFPITEDYFDPVTGWTYVLVKLEDISSLKFAQSDSVFEVSGKIRDVIERNRQYNVRVVRKPNLFDIRYLYAGLRNVSQSNQVFSGQIWLNDIYAGDVRRDIGYAERVSASATIGGGVLSLGGNWQKRDADFRGLRERRGSGVVAESYSMNAKTRVEHFIPLFGFSVPISGNYSKSTTLPRYLPNGDTEISSPSIRDSLRTERVTRSFSTSLVKKGSKNPILKYTIDKLNTNFAFSEQMNRSPTARDTTRSMNGSLSYQINWSKPRDIKLIRGAKFRYWLNAVNFRMNASRRTTRRSRFRNGQFVRDPFLYDAAVNMSGSANYKPFNSLTSSFSGSLNRDLRRPHYVYGIDIGREVGRAHNLQISYKPPNIFLISAFSPDVNLNTAYNENSDPNIRRPGDPTGTRNVTNQRQAGVKMKFDVGKYFGKIFGAFGLVEEEEPPTKGSRPGGPPKTGQGPAVGKPPSGQQTAEEDTTEAPTRPRADPMVAVRKLGQILADIRKVNINVQQRFNSSYTRIPERPSYLYQFGLTESSGIVTSEGDLDTPDRSSTDLTLTLDSGVQVSTNIDVSTRFTTTMRNSSTQGSESESQSMTWPDVSLKWGGLEHFGLFRPIFMYSSANLTYKKQTQETGRGGIVDSHRESLTISPSMAFTFKNEITSTLSMSYSKNTSDNRGSITETSNMSITLDLKKNFTGGSGFKLPIPFLAKKIKWSSTLNSNLNISYARSGGKRYQTGEEIFQPIPRTSSLRVSPNLTYNFSRALNGRFFVDYGRTYAEASDQTTTTLRIGVSAVLTF